MRIPEGDLADFMELLEVLFMPMLPFDLKRARKPKPFDPDNPLDPSLDIKDLFAAHIKVCRMPYINAALERMRARQKRG